jgi:hypothetical protein
MIVSPYYRVVLRGCKILLMLPNVQKFMSTYLVYALYRDGLKLLP